jgi:hypothetical protein
MRQRLAKLIQVRLNVEDYKKIQGLAHEMALPPSSWLRMQIHLWLRDMPDAKKSSTPRRVIRTTKEKEEVKADEKNEFQIS